jgi:hypothetical protein
VAVLVGISAFALFHVALALTAARAAFIADPQYADRENRLREREQTAPTGAPRVVFLGSSRTLGAFDAGAVEQAAGTPAVVFNFGVPAAGPVAHAVYVRRLLAAGLAPDLLLLEVLPAQFGHRSSGPPELGLLSADRLTWDETELLVARYGFPGDSYRRRRAAADRAPWYTHRFKLLARLDPEMLPWQQRTDSGRAADSHGWSPVAEGLHAHAPAFAYAAREYGEVLHSWELDPGAAVALRDVLTLCRASGTSVRLVLMPESRAFRELSPPATRARLAEFLSAIAVEFECPVIDAREWIPDHDLVDGHHQSREGARAFTDRIATEVILPFLRAREHR